MSEPYLGECPKNRDSLARHRWDLRRAVIILRDDATAIREEGVEIPPEAIAKRLDDIAAGVARIEQRIATIEAALLDVTKT